MALPSPDVYRAQSCGSASWSRMDVSCVKLRLGLSDAQERTRDNRESVSTMQTDVTTVRASGTSRVMRTG